MITPKTTEMYRVSVLDTTTSLAVHDELTDFDGLNSVVTSVRTAYPDAERYKILWQLAQVVI